MRAARAALLTISALLLALAACSEKPAAPEFDNVFDPAGPAGGDPFALAASVQGSRVVLTWRQVDHPLVSGYRLLRSLSEDGPYSDTGVAPLVPANRASAALATDTDFSPGVLNYYKVQALTNTGGLSSVSAVVAVGVLPPPYLRLPTDATKTATRYVTLRTRSDVGDGVEISNSPDFSGALAFGVTAGEETELDWTLPLASANGETLRVHVRARLDGGFSDPGSLALQVGFTPTLSILGSPGAVVDSLVTLTITTTGVESMRFAPQADALQYAPWMGPSDRVPWLLSTATADPQTVYGEFLGDFGFSDTTSVILHPVASVGEAGFTLAGGDSLTTTREVLVVSDVTGASGMRFSESPDFAGAPVLAYADTTVFTLSATPGRKTVYGWFTNPWDRTGTSAAASITLLGDTTP